MTKKKEIESILKSQSELRVEPETAELLQAECLKARHLLFHNDMKGYDSDEMRFAPYDAYTAEEERINALTNGMIKFIFDHKNYLQFTLEGCDMIFRINDKNAYRRVSEEVMKSLEVHSEMLQMYDKMKDALKLKYASSDEELISTDNIPIDDIINNVCETIKQYELALYLQEAQIYFNRLLKEALTNIDYTIEVGVTDNSFIFVKDNAQHKKENRAIFRGGGEDVVKYLTEGLKGYIKQINNNNKKKNKKMKKTMKTTAAKQGVAKQRVNENGIDNINVAMVTNYLLALMQPDSEVSQVLKMGKMDLTTWLSNSTNGVIVCNVTEDTMTLENSINNVLVTIPKEVLGEELVISYLTCLLGLKQCRSEEKETITPAAKEDKATAETSTSSVEDVDTSNETKIREEINKLFEQRVNDIFNKISASLIISKKKRFQILHGQLISIGSQCGCTSRKKSYIVSLLNERNKKEYQAMYDTIAEMAA